MKRIYSFGGTTAQLCHFRKDKNISFFKNSFPYSACVKPTANKNQSDFF